MIRAKFNFSGDTKRYVRNLEKNLLSAVQKSAILVQRQAVSLLNKSGKSAPAKSGLNVGSVIARKSRPKSLGMSKADMRAKGLYWYGEPLHRWVEASQPGSPPHKQTGRLQRSITIEVNAKKLSAKVGPAQMLVYARKLELGGDGVAPRPYLAPALDAMQAKIFKEIESAVSKTQP
jgi:hypothetical protein